MHTGERACVRFSPLGVGAGIVFYRNDLRLSSLSEGTGPESGLRCTSVGQGDERVLTVEHLLAAITALGIDNLRIDVEGPEIPGLDGSAQPFVRTFKALGILEQKSPREFYRVTEPVFCYDNKKAIAIYPAEVLSIAYVLDYGIKGLTDQVFDTVVTPETFEKEIAPARTFCSEQEAEMLRRQGFGKGATRENTLVIGAAGKPIGNTLRFSDECARHKALDILGDLNLLGFSVLGRVVALRSGHALNSQLVEAIKKQKERHDALQRKSP